METPYERGYQSGRVIDPSCCSLEEHEQIYQEEIDGLPDIKKKDPVQAAEHAIPPVPEEAKEFIITSPVNVLNPTVTTML